VTHRQLRRGLLVGGVLVALSSATALSLASQRIVAEESAFRAPATARCTPTTLNHSALLAGTPISVSPLPDSYDASPYTQISLLGAPKGAISNVHVNGSKTGSHHGRLRGYSQGDGASFVSSRPFRSGETVVVRGKVKAGGHSHRFAYHFVVSTPDHLPYAAPTLPSGKDPKEMQHYHSRPDLRPPAIAVTTRTPSASAEYVFAAPYSGPGPAGPMIFDEAGNLVWFDPIPGNEAAANLQVQQLNGQPVLTWWQGYIPPQGFGEGEEIIMNSSYRRIGRVRAGNGYKADLHDFHITPRGTAVLTAFSPVDCNLSALGGPRGGAVTDSVFQEVDLHTGLVRREWHSLDHVALGDSHSSAVSTSTEWPYDYFHVNSVDQLANGKTLISARNTWALYDLNTTTGQVLTRIGGRGSNVRLSAGATTAYQHDATVLANGTISVFDNGAVPRVHRQSRALVLAVEPHAKTDTVIAQYEHPRPLSSGSQGNVQTLANGDLFIGWGAAPYFSQFSPSGQVLFDAHMHGTYQSYRAYRLPWTGTAPGGPAVAASGKRGAPVTVYASWNGDTRTASWRVLAGPSAHQLTAVAVAGRTGFETAIATPGPEAFVAVQALDPAGNVLGTSHTIAG
jgi:Arylsulfotransferase (ASST)